MTEPIILGQAGEADRFHGGARVTASGLERGAGA